MKTKSHYRIQFMPINEALVFMESLSQINKKGHKSIVFRSLNLYDVVNSVYSVVTKIS
jgi:hypothetical protein